MYSSNPTNAAFTGTSTKNIITSEAYTGIFSGRKGCASIPALRFYVPLKNISLIWKRHHYRWRAAKSRPMLGVQGLWTWRDLYRATHAVTRGLGFSSLIRRTAPFSRLLQRTRECRGSILTWSVKFYELLSNENRTKRHRESWDDYIYILFPFSKPQWVSGLE
jgi:hypothetical protein